MDNAAPADYDPNKVLEIAEAKGWIVRDHTPDAHGQYWVTRAGLIELWKLTAEERKAKP